VPAKEPVPSCVPFALTPPRPSVTVSCWFTHPVPSGLRVMVRPVTVPVTSAGTPWNTFVSDMLPVTAPFYGLEYSATSS
jgi:hypothetical protein